jgi:hypothetical protein
MTKTLCMEHIKKECVNKNIKGIASMLLGLECPHCLREDGKNGFGDQLATENQASKLFLILKDKVKE